MALLTRHQIEQEGRRILRRMTSPRVALFARTRGDFAVARSPASASASRVLVSADFVAEFVRAAWIRADGPGRHVLAEAGHALLARAGEDGFAGQHRLMQDGADGERRISVNAAESSLARLKFRDLISATQFAAGERLRRDFTLGQLAPRMGVDWSAPVVSGGRGAGGDSISDVAIMARQRLNKALAAAGPGLSDMLFDVCCHLLPLERIEDARGWSRRSGRAVLMVALDRLAGHYGMDVVTSRGAMRAWQASGESEAG